MYVKKISAELLNTNCYVISNGNQAMIVDPAAGASEEVADYLEKWYLKPLAIVNTHGHADHIANNEFFKLKFDIPVLIHRFDAEYLTNNELNLASLVMQEFKQIPADRLLEDSEELVVGKEKLVVKHTPGHTPGSICLLGNGFVLSGDTLFFRSIGRTDFPGGDMDTLITSLQELIQLSGDTIVYPGHGRSTTIDAELKRG